MAEINWRQVAQASAPGIKLIQSSNVGLQKALTGLSQTADELDQRQTDTNTANVLANVRSLESVDQFNAAMHDKRFGHAALDKYGRNINRDAIRTGMVAQQAVAERPEKLNIANLLANKQFDEADAALADTNIQDKTKMYAASIAGRRQEDTYNEAQVTKQRVENERNVRLGATNLINQQAVTRSANVKKQKQIEQDFITKNKYQDYMSINSLGELEFKVRQPNTIRGAALSAKGMVNVRKDYEKYLADNSIKIKTDKERGDELSTLLAESKGVLSATEANALRTQQAEFNQSYRKYSHETQIVHDASVKEATQSAQIDRDLNQRKYQQVVDLNPVDIVVTPKMEKISLGDTKVQMRKDIDAEIAKHEEGIIATEFGETIDEREKKGISDLMDEVSNKTFTSKDGVDIPYPGWAIKEAYDIVGIEKFLKHGWTSEEPDIESFQSQLDNIMRRLVKSQNSRVLQDDAYKLLKERNLKSNEGLLGLTAKARYEANLADGKRANTKKK